MLDGGARRDREIVKTYVLAYSEIMVENAARARVLSFGKFVMSCAPTRYGWPWLFASSSFS